MNYLKIYTNFFIFILVCLIIFNINNNAINSSNNTDEINTLKVELNNTKHDFERLSNDYNILKKFIIETSNVPNEKRKSIFELKIKQDSALIDLLLNDVRSNKEILKLLDTEWVYNDSTEFKSLK